MQGNTEDFLALLRDQVKDLNENIKATLTLYNGWYNFFITLNAAALAFASDKGPKHAVALVFLFLNILGGASCLMIRSYVIKLTKHLNLTREELWHRVARMETSDPLTRQHFFPTVSADVIGYSIVGNALGIVLFEVIWIYLFVTAFTTAR